MTKSREKIWGANVPAKRRASLASMILAQQVVFFTLLRLQGEATFQIPAKT
jgi:hypothetical protein